MKPNEGISVAVFVTNPELVREDNMSIYEEKQQIEEILNSLDVDKLSRSHNSVNISFAQMLAYIDKLQVADYPKEITLLLQTYRAMAEKFYIQFELSLLREIEKQHNDQNLS